MSRNAVRSRFPILAVATLVAASLTGCVSVGVVRLRVADPQGGSGVVEVSIYETMKQKKLETPSRGGEEIELLMLEQGREVEIGTYPGPTCRKGELSPGTYRIRVRPGQTNGKSGQPAKVIAQKDLRVRAGETTHADVVLKKFPTTAVLVSAGVVVAAVAIAAATAPVIDFGSGGHFCGRHVDPDSERPESELPPLFDLVRPMPRR